jgi:hypothetical protein
MFVIYMQEGKITIFAANCYSLKAKKDEKSITACTRFRGYASIGWHNCGTIFNDFKCKCSIRSRSHRSGNNGYFVGPGYLPDLLEGTENDRVPRNV